MFFQPCLLIFRGALLVPEQRSPAVGLAININDPARHEWTGYVASRSRKSGQGTAALRDISVIKRKISW
jgi:hypothetical protein